MMSLIAGLIGPALCFSGFLIIHYVIKEIREAEKAIDNAQSPEAFKKVA